MEKKTMGSFMAALRKANGLTQQQVADKLNVSNKTVSGGTTDDDPTGGELAINNILIAGKKTNVEYQLGDCDLDTKITIMDATLAQRAVAKDITLSDIALTLADVDGDKKLTIMDATQIQRFVAKVIDKF